MLPKGFDHNTKERKGKKEIQKDGDRTEQYLHWGGIKKERKRKEERSKDGGQNRRVPPSGEEESRKDKGRRKKTGGQTEQNRTVDHQVDLPTDQAHFVSNCGSEFGSK